MSRTPTIPTPSRAVPGCPTRPPPPPPAGQPRSTRPHGTAAAAVSGSPAGRPRSGGGPPSGTRVLSGPAAPAGGRASARHAAAGAFPPAAPRPAAATPAPPAQPVFTPESGGAGGTAGGRAELHAREGYAPPDGRRRDAAPPPTAFFSPAPAGYQPVPVPEEYGYAPAAAAPRFTPVDRQASSLTTRTTAPGSSSARSARRVNRTAADSRRHVAEPGPVEQGDGVRHDRVPGNRLPAHVRALVRPRRAQLSGAYNNSNTLPNTVYYLMLGGIFTAVVVPLLVRAAKEDPDRGEAYAERIFTLGVVSLLIVTVVATLLAARWSTFTRGASTAAGVGAPPPSTTSWCSSRTSSSRRSSSTAWTRCSARS